MGLHYVGELASQTRFVARLFRYLSKGQLTWVDMGKVYDRVVIEGESFDICKSSEAFIDSLSGYFPQEKVR